MVASNGTIAADKITFNSANLRINKNTTVNLKVVVDTKSNLNEATSTTAGKTFIANITGQAQKVSTSGNTNLTGTANTKTYTVSSQAPTVQVTALPLNADAPVSRIKFTNEDPNQNLKLKEVKLRVSFRTTTNGTAPSIKGVCLRNVGSSSECTGTGTPTDVKYVEPQADGIYNFTDLAGLNIKDDITSGNYSEVEVFVLGVTDVAVAGDNVTTSVQTVKYNTDQNESYVGRSGASAVSTK